MSVISHNHRINSFFYHLTVFSNLSTGGCSLSSALTSPHWTPRLIITYMWTWFLLTSITGGTKEVNGSSVARQKATCQVSDNSNNTAFFWPLSTFKSYKQDKCLYLNCGFTVWVFSEQWRKLHILRALSFCG